jgi:hypothetical protein
MKTPLLSLMALAGLFAAGCTAPGISVAPRTHAPAWHDTGTPPASVVVLEREVRYYRDETGAIWDDRGRKLGAGS